MALKKEPEKHANHERWLVSYADFITLLFAVFVTMYAMSQTDKKKVEEVAASMRESFGYSTQAAAGQKGVLQSQDIKPIPAIKPEMAVIPMINKMPPAGPRQGGMDKGRGKGKAEEKEFKEIQSAIEAYLIKHGAQNKVTIGITRRGLVVSLKEAGFFDSGSAVIKPAGYQLLNTILEAMTEYSNPLRVEGHTDNIPISTPVFPSNWELSVSRATNVLRYLQKNYDVEPGKLSATGYGEFRPTTENTTAEGRAKNRRVDIVLLSGDAEQGEP
ncbi:chemotaxis protein MotB [Trichlorobacter thiogenes]|uniref:Chemotaxis protein MotB n=1 Tax=Trichlorobacter thiogenes TaxID=115783 RepID=A0A1T4KA27_9BACT|nr:flagellar motor protein MotB [Trichlorobacter thiogenes]SJZ39173.1 chemotaxis protein MotB [Trichlorobacter thiogenes]